MKDEKGTPLPGVTVVLKGENLGVATDVNGNYSLSFLDQKNLVILFSFVGMLPVEVKYTGQDTINVVLKEDVEKIDEVVVNGYFTRKKESYTGVSTTFQGVNFVKCQRGVF